VQEAGWFGLSPRLLSPCRRREERERLQRHNLPFFPEFHQPAGDPVAAADGVSFVLLLNQFQIPVELDGARRTAAFLAQHLD
jgi:hypothetical protein